MLDLKLDNWVLSQLSAPFEPEELLYRVASGRSNQVLAYLDARTVADRLNYVVGTENWQDSYTPFTITHTDDRETTNVEVLKENYETDLQGFEQGDIKQKPTDPFWRKGGEISGVKKEFKTYESEVNHYGGVQCSLTILGVTKQDAGAPTYAEKVKGAYSDALKRAAVKFGIGSYLYDLKGLTAPSDRGIVLEIPDLPDWAYPPQQADADSAIKALRDKLWETHTAHRATIATIMTHYSASSPLIVKRAVMGLLKDVEAIETE